MSNPDQKQPAEVPAPSVIDLPKLIELRNKYAQGIAQINQQIEQAKRDKIATEGALVAVEALIQSITPKDLPPKPEPK